MERKIAIKLYRAREMKLRTKALDLLQKKNVSVFIIKNKYK
jgi:hypothetical protein